MKIGCGTLSTLANGKVADLLEPKLDDISLTVFCHHLALLNRYGGATTQPYSVAEHTLRGVRAIRGEGGDVDLQRAFLLHDFHEAVLGDTVTPLKRALGALAVASHQLAIAESLGELYRMLGYRWDAVIHQAFGMPWPLPLKLQQQVEFWDMRMLRTEWRDLMAGEPGFAWPAGIEPCHQTIVPMRWTVACHDLLVEAHALFEIGAAS